MRPINIFRVLACGVAVASLAACYTQTALDTYPPVQNTRIQAKVTDSGVVAMANALGPGAEEVQGVVARADNDSLSLQMLRVDHRGGSSVMWNREVVSFPRNALRGATVTRLDRNRSWMAAVGIGVGAFLAARAFQSLGADEGVDDTPNPAATLLIPFGRSR